MSEPQRSWWSRNWKWVVPVGCLLPLVVCGGGVALIAYFAFNLLQSTEPYLDAVAKAKASPAVVAALGEPIQEGRFVGGSFKVRHINGVETGEVNFAIPLSGPKGSGTLRVIGTKAGGKWTYSVMDVTVLGQGPPINLLAADG
jgi:hypothetical protein